MLVDFLLVGAQKSGTTTLHSYLNDHPQIEMAKKKEVHFFDNEQFFLNQAIDYEYYHSWFEQEQNINNLRGEATPAYLYCRDAATRIWRYNPTMKIIIILRNPIERAFSHWNMEYNRGAESLSFIDALTQEEKRCREALPLQHYTYSYIDRGFYSSQIREYWRLFGREQVLVLNYDQLKNNPISVLNDLYDFLDINHITLNNIKILHKTHYTASLDKHSRALLQKEFYFEILQLENMLSWDCSHWLGN